MAGKTGPKSALGALNEALESMGADESTVEELDEEIESDDTDEELGDDEAGDGEDAGDGDDSGDDEGDGETDEGDDGEPADENGAEPESKAKGAEEDKAKKPDVKKADPINDPIPEGLKKETRERMQSLISTVKEKDKELTTARTEFNTLVDGIKATGATPEQYGEVMNWMSLFNSNSVEDKRKAYDFVESVADRLATLIGIDRAIQDPLAAHADLKNAVATKAITLEYAKEIARTRNRQGFQSQIETQQQQAQRTQQQQQEEEQAARNELTAFENEMRETDPLYERKKAELMKTHRSTIKRLPKSQWAEAFKEAYANVRIRPKGTVGAKPGSQPLRGNKQPAGGAKREPNSALEAMNGALAAMK